MPTKITGTSNPASTSQSPTLTQIIQSLSYVVKRLTGGTNYYDEPPISVDELNNYVESLTDLNDSLTLRITTLENKIFPVTLWRYGADTGIPLSTSAQTLASFTINAGVVDNGQRILVFEAGFSTFSTTGNRNVSINVGNTAIWSGTLGANVSVPVKKVISFAGVRPASRTFNTTNTGYAQTSSLPLTSFADFSQAQTLSIRGSAASNGLGFNIDYAILTML